VALALTWIASPERFEVKPPVDELLVGQDRAGLIAIIQRFIARDPTLETMFDNIGPAAPLEIAPAKPGDAANVTLDIARIRSRLDDALDKNRDVCSISNEWDEDYNGYANEAIAIKRVESVFDEMFDIGERYEQAGRFADAVAVYALVATVGTERFDDTFENDAVFGLIFAAGRGLVRCLDQQARLPDRDRLPPQLRSHLIDTVHEIWCFAGHGQWGDDITGVPDSDEEVAELAGSQPDVAGVVSANLTDDERRQLEDHWRSEAADAGNPDWRSRSAIAFGSAFSGPDGFGDDEALALIIAAELWWDQAMLLLDQGNPAEATAVAIRKLTNAHDAVLFANELVKRGGDGPQRAIRFIDERLWETEGKVPTDDLVYRSWLAGAYAQIGTPEEAIEARLRLFELQPNFGGYKELQKLAMASGADSERRAELRANALTTLAKAGNRGAIMEIYLEEGNAREALTLLADQTKPDRERLQSLRWGWGWNVQGYREKVAKLAEDEFPDDALGIYRGLVDQLIAQKNRSSYHAAAGHLAAIKRVLDANGRGDEWQTLIGAIREANPKLRALKDELDRAGL
jgi:tetratricopeptide (TPR) repeat protein